MIIKDGGPVEGAFFGRTGGRTEKIKDLTVFCPGESGDSYEFWVNGALCYISEEEVLSLIQELSSAYISAKQQEATLKLSEVGGTIS